MLKRQYEEKDTTFVNKRQKSSSFEEDVPELFSIFNGEVAKVQPYGVFVKIPGFRKQGLVHKSQMSRARVDDPSEMLSVGEKIYCKVISVEDNKIGLSMKVVNQTTGKDEDPSNVQHSLDERKKKKGHQREIPKIELGAVLDTTCKKCGGHGHFAQDCFHTKGGKVYELIPEEERKSLFKEPEKSEEESTKKKKKKKKEKKHKKDTSAKKSKKHKHHHHRNSTSSSSSSESEEEVKHKKKHKKDRHRHKKKRSSSSSSSEG